MDDKLKNYPPMTSIKILTSKQNVKESVNLSCPRKERNQIMNKQQRKELDEAKKPTKIMKSKVKEDLPRQVLTKPRNPSKAVPNATNPSRRFRIS